MNWHSRYLLQAQWTHELRNYLFQKAGLTSAHRVLEVGCGTGAILCDLIQPDQALAKSAALYGLDILQDSLAECRVHTPGALLACGDGLDLPFLDQVFDITYCHFLLLWVHDPLEALREMKRVTRPQGHILALAEPDYTARVDRPYESSSLGKIQTESLKKQGADVSIGSRLAEIFYQADIQILESGKIRDSSGVGISHQEWENEWAVLDSDLAGYVSKEELLQIRHLDEQAWRRREHKISVPTYFAWGQV
jgi:SAM-dependent methyltransferase